jgi:hypothetical protein
MVLPGVNSVIVPVPSVVVVVVVVSVTCAHANGAATANAILSISFFISIRRTQEPHIRIGIYFSRRFTEKVEFQNRSEKSETLNEATDCRPREPERRLTFCAFFRLVAEAEDGHSCGDDSG